MSTLALVLVLTAAAAASPEATPDSIDYARVPKIDFDGKTNKLHAGQLGVARIRADHKASLDLEILFPAELVLGTNGEVNDRRIHGKVEADKKLVLFDEKGPLATIDGGTFTLENWCENDGGDHFRPRALLRVPKKLLSRTIADPGKGQVAAFVSVGAKPRKNSAVKTPGSPVLLTGDLDRDGKPDAVVWKMKSEAGCGPKLEDPTTPVLRTTDGDIELECCGP